MESQAESVSEVVNRKKRLIQENFCKSSLTEKRKWSLSSGMHNMAENRFPVIHGGDERFRVSSCMLDMHTS